MNQANVFVFKKEEMIIDIDDDDMVSLSLSSHVDLLPDR